MLRSRLRKQIRDAWKLAVLEDYTLQRINSERSLQASVWSRLNDNLPKKTRRMFIEPAISCGTQKKYPDIVICNTRQIIAIIELKYTPRAFPTWKKDIRSFHWMVKNRSNVLVSNVRHRGVAVDARKYQLSRNALFVWAGIHAKCDVVIKNEVAPMLRKCFLELHAETVHGVDAVLRKRSRGDL